MNYFQHRFDRIEDYLHHRSPYLMVDKIVSIGEKEIVTSSIIQLDAFYLTGHFPGAPIVPGAMMQEMTTQSAGILIAANYNPMQTFDTSDPYANEYALGVLVKVKQARYRGFARPGDELKITVSLAEKVSEVFDFTGKIEFDGKVICKNRFQLTNIPSTILRGTE